jgi:hypothetical protein
MLICAFSETLRKPEKIDHYPEFTEQTGRLFARMTSFCRYNSRRLFAGITKGGFFKAG